MSRPRSSRYLALALSSLIATTAALLLLKWNAEAEPDLTLVEGDVEGALDAASVEAQSVDAGPTESPDGAPAAPPFDPARPWLAWRHHVPEEPAIKLMPQLKGGDTVYDPWCGYVYAPFRETGHRWAEHPDGRIEKRANGIGIRCETEVRAVKPELRVLVAGDSHVDGVCNPREGYPMLLQRGLEDTLGAGDVEVINAAHGGYSFHNYLGTLERFVHLGFAPDVFVMTVFVGNDFTGMLAPMRFLARSRGEPAPRRESNEAYRDHVKRQQGAQRNLRFAYGQGLGSVGYLRHLPGEIDVIQDASLALTREAQARCDELGVELLVVVLPSPVELLDQANRTLVERGLEDAGLEADDIERMSALRERYVRSVLAEGIACVDLWNGFARHDGLLFWNRDLHLNLDGHRLAAQAVEEDLLQTLKR